MYFRKTSLVALVVIFALISIPLFTHAASGGTITDAIAPISTNANPDISYTKPGDVLAPLTRYTSP